MRPQELVSLKRVRLNEENVLAITNNEQQLIYVYKDKDGELFKQMYDDMVSNHKPPNELQSNDFNYEIENIRWRGHIFHHMKGWSVCIKRLPSESLSLSELGFHPGDITSFIRRPGLSFFAGPTDAGKSTSMTAALMHLHREGTLGETVTIEQPIEYVYKEIEIVQRGVDFDVESYEQGIRDAVRESPRTIVVGEIRDRPSAMAAVQAGLIGHRVLTTLHGNNIVDAVSKLFSLLDATHRDVLPQALTGCIAQQLIKGVDSSMVLVYECLEVDNDAEEIIRQGASSLRQLGNVFNSQRRPRISENAREKMQKGYFDQMAFETAFK